LQPQLPPCGLGLVVKLRETPQDLGTQMFDVGSCQKRFSNGKSAPAIFCDDRSEETADNCNAMGTFGNTVIDMLIMIVSPDINCEMPGNIFVELIFQHQRPNLDLNAAVAHTHIYIYIYI
jgi:hypothetical protein